MRNYGDKNHVAYGRGVGIDRKGAQGGGTVFSLVLGAGHRMRTTVKTL